VPAGASGNSQYNVESTMKTVSKWLGYLDGPERTPDLMRRAFAMPRSGRPSPVALPIPDATSTCGGTAPHRALAISTPACHVALAMPATIQEAKRSCRKLFGSE